MIGRFLLGLLLAGFAALQAETEPQPLMQAGPLIQKFPLTLKEGVRTEALGPLLVFEHSGFWEQWAFSPFLSYAYDGTGPTKEFDILYPFVTYDKYGPEYRLRWFLMITFSGGRTQNEDREKRFTLFPFFFLQRSENRDDNYTAVFPFYGTIRKRLTRDEMKFAMFPIYGRTKKRDVTTWNYLYPFVHYRTGDELKGWQFWPFYGTEKRNPLVRTNNFGDPFVIGGHRKRFILWPFHFDQVTGIATTNPVSVKAFIPFYTQERSPSRDSTTVLFPLFSVTDDRAEKYKEYDLPFPFIVIARGEGKTATRVFPLFSKVRRPGLESAFYLWPLYKYNRQHFPPLDRQRTRLGFFIYSNTREINEDTGQIKKRISTLPLFQSVREFNGDRRFQMLAILEPFLPNNENIQRNWSQIWALWRYQRNAETGALSHSFLWNLYRLQSEPEVKRHSALFGLFQFEKRNTRKRLRLFYLPVSWGKAPTDESLIY